MLGDTLEEPVIAVFENISKLLAAGLFPGNLSPLVMQCREFLETMIQEQRSKLQKGEEVAVVKRTRKRSGHRGDKPN